MENEFQKIQVIEYNLRTKNLSVNKCHTCMHITIPEFNADLHDICNDLVWATCCLESDWEFEMSVPSNKVIFRKKKNTCSSKCATR